METKLQLEEKTITDLNTLTRINLDSEEALTQLKEKLDGAPASYFAEVATQRAAQAKELQSLVGDNAEEPATCGTTVGSLQRTWANLKTALGGGKQTILNEAEAEEDRIKDSYEEVLKGNPGTAISDVLHRHIADVKVAHDRIRDLRDAEKAK